MPGQEKRNFEIFPDVEEGKQEQSVESKSEIEVITESTSDQRTEKVNFKRPVNISDASTPAISQAQPADELTEEIEEILEEDLGEIYKKLPEDRKQKFKEEGEKTAGIIKQFIEKGKFHGRKVVSLIVKWLKLIPGVNKFFLEQESKIKADKLFQIAEEQKKKSKL